MMSLLYPELILEEIKEEKILCFGTFLTIGIGYHYHLFLFYIALSESITVLLLRKKEKSRAKTTGEKMRLLFQSQSSVLNQ